MIKLYSLLVSVVISSTLAGIYQPAFAASNAVNGLSVSPAINTIQLKSGQSSTSITENIGNITNNKLAVFVSARDFGMQGSDGSIGFFGSSYKTLTNPHGLAKLIQLPTTELFIEAHQSKTVTLDLTNLDTLSPGGHYAAILFSPLIAINGKPKNQVNVQPSVSSLIFLTTPTGGVQSFNISSVNVPAFGLSLPTTVYATLDNTGNTQITPQGFATMVSPNNDLVSRSVINSNSGIILPGTSRLFTIKLTSSHNILKIAGIYKYQFKFRLSGSNNYQSVTKNFLYLNPIFLLYLAIIIGFVYFIKNSKKKTPPKASTSTKKFNKKS